MKRALILAAAIAALAGPTAAQPQERGAPPPSGSYWQTCRNVSTYGYGPNTTVTAQCRDDRGRWRATSLRSSGCREIENRNGALVCADYGRPPGGGDGGRPPWGGGGGRPPWGGGGGRGGSITLYSGPDFSGQPYETREEVTNLPRQYNDRALSLRIQGRGSWTVCADSDFRGRCQTFDRDVKDLRPYGLGEAITSMRPDRR